MTKSHEQEFWFNDLRWACKVWGNESNPPLLAVHGWLDNANSFDMLAPTLSERFQVFAFDLPGHGLSDHLPQGRHYQYADLLSDLALVLEKLSLSMPVVMLGHSLGGALGVCLAALFPEKVRACVTIDALGPLVTPVAETVSAMRKGILARHDWQARPPRVIASKKLAVASRMKSEWPVSEAAAIALCDRGTEPVEGGWRWSADPRWKLPSITRLCEEQVQSILSDVQVPVLLATASEGLVKKIPTLARRKACLQHCQEAVFEGGHHVHMEHQAQLLAQWVIDQT